MEEVRSEDQGMIDDKEVEQEAEEIELRQESEIEQVQELNEDEMDAAPIEMVEK